MPRRGALRNGRLLLATNDTKLYERGTFDSFSYASHVRVNEAGIAANRIFLPCAG